MASNASPLQKSFFAPREAVSFQADGPFDFSDVPGFAASERDSAEPVVRERKLVMPNRELTSAKPPKRPKRPAANMNALMETAVSSRVQPTLFDAADRAEDASPAPTSVACELQPAPAVRRTSLSHGALFGRGKQRKYAPTVLLFAAIAAVSGGLGFLSAPEPQLITASITPVDPVPVLEASLPLSAALDVPDNGLLQILTAIGLCLLLCAVSFGALFRWLSPARRRTNTSATGPVATSVPIGGNVAPTA